MSYRVEWPTPADGIGDAIIDDLRRARELAQERADESRRQVSVWTVAFGGGRKHRIHVARPKKET